MNKVFNSLVLSLFTACMASQAIEIKTFFIPDRHMPPTAEESLGIQEILSKHARGALLHQSNLPVVDMDPKHIPTAEEFEQLNQKTAETVSRFAPFINYIHKGIDAVSNRYNKMNYTNFNAVLSNISDHKTVYGGVAATTIGLGTTAYLVKYGHRKTAAVTGLASLAAGIATYYIHA